ncbi:RING-type domain-containing protein [Mycena indigotica]|uniref:RING-type domain-containing protein n=1 Tax=Mycena indigotica TaxID=2126181 RepID=A0A8H6T5T4_9AGAR|nr:RING-type domain-containing protein [Mycena indigotica]KAF7312620.1 RING-type domain-containing protein [Mycena indigotica]
MTTIWTGDLQQLLQCPVAGCDETLYQPTTLDCGHTVCKHHVQGHACPVTTCAAEMLDEEIVPRPMRLRIPPGSRMEYEASLSGSGERPHLDLQEPPKVNRTVEDILAFLDEEDDIGDALKPKTIFTSELYAKLTCLSCSKLLYNPITTPCQHTFCAECLRMSLFHGNTCPLRCRSRFGGFEFWEEHPMDSLMQNLLLNFFPDHTAQRDQANEGKKQDSAWTPIFIVSLVLPGQECSFQIFEPRYRLMLRRCLEHTHKSQSSSGFPTMGLMMHDGRANVLRYGCLVEITKVQMVYDGRAYVEVRGTVPFRVVHGESLDGYVVARTKILRDIPASLPSPTPRSRSTHNDKLQIPDLVEICLGFLSLMKRHGHDVVDRITRVHGQPPISNPSLLSFWFARILPLNDFEKAEILAMQNSRDRLDRVIYWISRAAGPELV